MLAVRRWMSLRLFPVWLPGFALAMTIMILWHELLMVFERLIIDISQPIRLGSYWWA